MNIITTFHFFLLQLLKDMYKNDKNKKGRSSSFT
jgi:hypothetical protein